MIDQHVFYKTKIENSYQNLNTFVHNSFYEFYAAGLKILKHVAKLKLKHLLIVLTGIYLSLITGLVTWFAVTESI